MKRLINNVREWITRKDREIAMLKLKLENTEKSADWAEEQRRRILEENLDLKQSVLQLCEDIRGLKEDKENLEKALEESEEDVQRINGEWASARDAMRGLSRTMIQTIELFAEEEGLDLDDCSE